MSKLQAIQKGSQIIDQIFWEFFNLIKNQSGLTEADLARFIRRRARQLGADGMAFEPTIVAWGVNSAEIHHTATTQRIGRNNFLMLDYGVKVSGFCSDFTRTLFIGRPNKHHQKIYNTVLKAQLAALKQVRIGANCRRIDLTARNIITRAGFPSFKHRTGHSLGRKIHEAPLLGPDSIETLPKNVIATIEPGIYLPGKYGVRIEDMILVSHQPKIFSKIPKDFKSMIIKI